MGSLLKAVLLSAFVAFAKADCQLDFAVRSSAILSPSTKNHSAFFFQSDRLTCEAIADSDLPIEINYGGILGSIEVRDSPDLTTIPANAFNSISTTEVLISGNENLESLDADFMGTANADLTSLLVTQNAKLA